MPADELLQACAAAPRFGVNAKAIILQAAAEVDEEEEPPVPPQLDGGSEVVGMVYCFLIVDRVLNTGHQASQSSMHLLHCNHHLLAQAWHPLYCKWSPTRCTADPRQQEWECLARAAEFLEAVDPRLRPLVTYVPRSKLPRAAR